MTYDPNDPRLTAYVLGELDEAERKAVEAQLAECAESRGSVEEIRTTAELLAAQLRKEPSPGLSLEQREAIERQLVKPRRKVSIRWVSFAVAASLLIGAVGLMALPSIQHSRKAPLIVASNFASKEHVPVPSLESPRDGATRPDTFSSLRGSSLKRDMYENAPPAAAPKSEALARGKNVKGRMLYGFGLKDEAQVAAGSRRGFAFSPDGADRLHEALSVPTQQEQSGQPVAAPSLPSLALRR